MKKIISFITLIFLVLNFLASPLYFFNIREKGTWLKHKSEFTKRMIEIDSLIINKEDAATVQSSNTSTYYFYYEKGKYISLSDNLGALFHSKNEVIKTRNALNYFEQHNDSLVIWYHPTLNGQAALPEETEMNTN